MKTIDETVAENIAARLERANMTQKELAKKAKLSVEGVNKVLRGRRRPSRATLEAIASALGCVAEDFFAPKVERSALDESLANTVSAQAKLIVDLQLELADAAKRLRAFDKLKDDSQFQTLLNAWPTLDEFGRLGVLYISTGDRRYIEQFQAAALRDPKAAAQSLARSALGPDSANKR